MIKLTPAATEEIVRRRTDESGSILRVAASSGGCGGFEYFMEFDRLREGDATFPLGDLTLVVDPDSAPMLEGTTVDYVEAEEGLEFTFSNPNDSGS